MNTATQIALVTTHGWLMVYELYSSGCEALVGKYAPGEIEHVELAPAPAEEY